MLRRHHEISQAAVDYEAARLPRELSAAITWYMDHKKPRVTRADLARMLGVTPGRVSQILSGDENVTLRTVATVCVALGAQLETPKLVDHDGLRDRADVPVNQTDYHGGRRDRHPQGIMLSGRK
jgi:transcriptional regulator with XRE-family HTH domain